MAKLFQHGKYLPARIFFIALIIRLIRVLLSSNLGIGLDDNFQHDMLARSIEAGNGFRWYEQEDLFLAKQYIDIDMPLVDKDPRCILTSIRPPLYPAFWNWFISYLELTRTFFFTRILQALMGAALAPLTYYVTKSIIPLKSKWSEKAAGIVS